MGVVRKQAWLSRLAGMGCMHWQTLGFAPAHIGFRAGRQRFWLAYWQAWFWWAAWVADTGRHGFGRTGWHGIRFGHRRGRCAQLVLCLPVGVVCSRPPQRPPFSSAVSPPAVGRQVRFPPWVCRQGQKPRQRAAAVRQVRFPPWVCRQGQKPGGAQCASSGAGGQKTEPSAAGRQVRFPPRVWRHVTGPKTRRAAPGP